MKFDLTNKNALVTGGSSGIGRAITETLKSQGADVYVLDLNENNANWKDFHYLQNIDTLELYRFYFLIFLCLIKNFEEISFYLKEKFIFWMKNCFWV